MKMGKVQEKGKFEREGRKIGRLVDKKQQAYGDAFGKAPRLLEIFLEDYLDEDGENYVIPKEMLPHLAVQVRILDKQNRVFSNPKADLMDETPYQDIAGYGLLAVKQQEKMANETEEDDD